MPKCPICNVEASYISQYGRYYCYQCSKYLAPGIPPPSGQENFAQGISGIINDQQSIVNNNIKNDPDYVKKEIKKSLKLNWGWIAVIIADLLGVIAIGITLLLPIHKSQNIDETIFAKIGLPVLIIILMCVVNLIIWIIYGIWFLATNKKRQKEFDEKGWKQSPLVNEKYRRIIWIIAIALAALIILIEKHQGVFLAVCILLFMFIMDRRIAALKKKEIEKNRIQQ